jgi:undecaprenyl diphosphate synthase
LSQDNAAPAPPQHIAITMDGNGRWASARGLPRAEGHRRGADAARQVVEAAAKFGVKHLTLFSFSSENWSRPQDEVQDLMGILRWRLRSEVADMHKQGVRLRIIGDRARLPTDIAKLIDDAEAMTDGNRRITVTMALSYGGRNDLVQAAKRMAADGLTPDQIDETAIAERLSTAGSPPPDLMIRTGGEMRISNFLLWECAYAEFLFSNVMWPDFGADELAAAIESFQGRERRYGGLRAG